VNIIRRLTAEGIGSLLLAATVIGSGVMAERLAGGNMGLALLANTAATVAAALLGPVSGAHFNPAVSVVQALRNTLLWREAGAYALVQIAGCCPPLRYPGVYRSPAGGCADCATGGPSALR
jgi:glycerol uptake facilitator-like aquaporin